MDIHVRRMANIVEADIAVSQDSFALGAISGQDSHMNVQAPEIKALDNRRISTNSYSGGAAFFFLRGFFGVSSRTAFSSAAISSRSRAAVS